MRVPHHVTYLEEMRTAYTILDRIFKGTVWETYISKDNTIINLRKMKKCV
jgi:hypothetical protein